MTARTRTRKTSVNSLSRAQRTKARTRNALQKLAARIEQKIGGPGFQSILETIDKEIGGTQVTRRTTKYVDGMPPLATENAVRAASLRARILAGALSSDQAGTYINRSRPIVNKMAKVGALLAIADGRNLRFPKWQFADNTEDGLVPGLHDVLGVMDASPFRKAAWFITENPALGNRAPVDVLLAGEIRRVVKEAKSLIGF